MIEALLAKAANQVIAAGTRLLSDFLKSKILSKDDDVKALVDSQKQLLDVAEKLRQRVLDLEVQIAKSKSATFDPHTGAVWRTGRYKKLGPHCSGCWHKSGLLIPLKKTGRLRRQKSVNIDDSREPLSARTAGKCPACNNTFPKVFVPRAEPNT